MSESDTPVGVFSLECGFFHFRVSMARYTGSRGLFLLYTLEAAQGLLTAPAQAETRV